MIVAEPSRARAPARLLAVVFALVLVGASVAVRELVIDPDNDEGGDSRGAEPSGELAILCVPDLREVCSRLDADVTVEALDETLARFTAGDTTDVDAWVTYAPLGEDARGQLEPGEILARTPLVLVAPVDRARALTTHCGSQRTWSCLGTVADAPWFDIGGQPAWRDVRPAHAEPFASALGRLVIGQAVASYLGSETFLPIDWQSDDGFAGWFQRLELAVPPDAFEEGGADPFTRWIRTRPVGARYDTVATTEAQAVTRLATAAPDIRDAATLIYPAPMATADVVLHRVAGARDVASVLDDLRDTLEVAGYRVDGAVPEGAADDAPDLPESDGLPSAGVLQALADYWDGVVG